MAAQPALSVMCPEAEREVRDFTAHADAVLGAGAEPSPASLSALASSAKELVTRPGRWVDADDKAAAGSTIAELLSRPAFKRALLLVTNESTRWSWSPGQRSAEEQEGLKAKIEALEAVVRLCGELLGSSTAAAPVLDFARHLVLSQTLEALSGRLADARAELDFLSDRAAAAADAGGARLFLQADAPALLLPLVPIVDLVGAAASLAWGCLLLATREPDAGPEPQSAAAAAASGAAPEPSAPSQPAGAAASGGAGSSDAAAGAGASACYAQELAAALRASAVVEHTCAALASAFRLWAVFGSAAADEPPRGDPAVYDTFSGHADRTVHHVARALAALDVVQSGKRSASLARAAALGPGGFYTALAHGIAVLSAMDDEGTHGLEPSVQHSFTHVFRMTVKQNLLARFKGGGPQPRRSDSLGSLMFLIMLLTADDKTLLDAAAARAMLPRSAVRPLAMRIARLGLQAAAEAAAGRTQEESLAALQDALTRRLSAKTSRALLEEEEAALLASAALHEASSAARGGAGPPGSADLGEEWWRLAAALAPHLQAPACVHGVSFSRDYGGNVLGQLPVVALPPAPLPPAPPLGLESALAGGVLPCLERLLRRTAAGLREGGPPPPEVEASTALSELDGGLWTRLAPLLAWGDARQAAALVRTVGKGLEAAASISSSYFSPADKTLAALAGCVLAGGRIWLEGLAASTGARRPGLASGALGAGLGGGGPGALYPAERQLLAMLAAAMATWLPPLCRLLWARHRDQAGVPGSAPLITCLCWLPLLARIDATHGPPTRPSAVVAAGAAAAGAAAGAAPGGTGWAKALASPVQTVGVALGGIGGESEDTYLRYVAQACCAVAAALPEEVMRLNDTDVAWQPQQLRSLGAECRARGDAAAAEAAEALAAQLVRWAHGSGPRGGRGGARASAASGAQALAARFGAWFPGLEAAAALLPASPAAARACLGGCSTRPAPTWRATAMRPCCCGRARAAAALRRTAAASARRRTGGRATGRRAGAALGALGAAAEGRMAGVIVAVA
ncbi:hypothetical protein HYH03_018344 [Edaphochlamys debaryana]|uniref:Uncharacterized protein n=1 Tax=Edaphochlamys debaryana TaxID=47281 RepID=A0A835XKI3_9CHLO|nr:hypothetical protein HYH03_018344 [Edaphochlamys debaryana]|eukprot:KAG2482750.1 hypothetical protein HYH03_018344 [Edaphochlamys debaryana]